MKKKLLILIVAFNHEKFIHKVLDRINENLTNTYDVEILINDDSSSDETVKVAKEYIKNSTKKFKYTILSNPINQGYGGNQKIGFLYAIKNHLRSDQVMASNIKKYVWCYTKFMCRTCSWLNEHERVF